MIVSAVLSTPFSTIPVIEDRTLGADKLTIVKPKVDSIAKI